MPVDPPDSAALAAVAQRYGLGLDADDLDSFGPMVHGLLASWDAVEELYNATAPPMPDRRWSRPEAADNPYNAWYVRCEVTGSGSGPLAGKTVAVKDNTSVAGRAADERLDDDGGLPSRAGTPPSCPGCWPPGRRSPASPSARTSASPAARTPRAPARCATRGTRPAPPAARPRAAPRWWPPASSTSAPAATRAARSGCRPRSPGSSGTSRPGAWSPTPARSRSSSRSTTSAR